MAIGSFYQSEKGTYDFSFILRLVLEHAALEDNP